MSKPKPIVTGNIISTTTQKIKTNVRSGSTTLKSSKKNLQISGEPPIEYQLWFRDKLEEQVQTDKSALISVFGTFASILAFLTVEFQFLKTINTLEKITGFTLILFSLLLSFNLVLDSLIKLRTQSSFNKGNLIIFGVLFSILIIGILVTSRSNYLDTPEWEKQKSELQNKIQNYEGRLDQLQNQIDISKITNPNQIITQQ